MNVPTGPRGLTVHFVATGRGEDTAYLDAGSGPAVVLIHGSGLGITAAANWWQTVPALAERYRVVAPDLIGFGRTLPAPDAEFGIVAWGAHLLRVLDTLDIPDAWLVGNSLGGWIALHAALAFPDRVRGVVSMGTGGGKRTAPSAPQGPATADSMRAALGKFVVNQSLVTDDLVALRMEVANLPGAGERFARAISSRDRDRTATPLTEDALRGLRQPVLLIHGREDAVIPVQRSWDLLQLIPDATLHVLPACGHWSQLEHAREFNVLTAGFITSREDAKEGSR